MCRWCGTTIYRKDGQINRRKTFCDPICVREYLIRVDPKVWRRAVYHRDMGICRGCGLVFDFYEDDGWEADHRIPLWYAHLYNDWTAWDLENGQLLCIDCHKTKTQNDYRRFGSPSARRAQHAA